MVDKATQYSAEIFIKKNQYQKFRVQSEGCGHWSIADLPITWMLTKVVTHPQELKERAKLDRFLIREAPIKTPGDIGTVESYHYPLRRSYMVKRGKMDKSTSNEECLQMETLAINSVTGLKGLYQMILVYEVIPRPAYITAVETQRNWAYAIDDEMREIEKKKARRRI